MERLCNVHKHPVPLPHCLQWEKMSPYMLAKLISAYTHCLPSGTVVIMHISNNGSVKFYVFPVLGNLMVSVETRSFCMIFSFTEMYFLD